MLSINDEEYWGIVWIKRLLWIRKIYFRRVQWVGLINPMNLLMNNI